MSSGDSRNYINKAEIYQISVDESGKFEQLLDNICLNISSLKSNNNIKLILKELDKDVNEKRKNFGFHKAMDNSRAIVAPLLAFIILSAFSSNY